jgi:hypothetical protein
VAAGAVPDDAGALAALARDGLVAIGADGRPALPC